MAYSKLIAGGVSSYADDNAQTSITTAKTTVKNNAFWPALLGVAWLADKDWMAYEVAQDVIAIRDGQKTDEQVTQEKEEYITGVVLGATGSRQLK